jgi:dipeptidyl aminopeptidase/acylaminoacyl peptidase
MRRRFSAAAIARLVFLLGIMSALPLAAQQKPTLAPEDYARWETLGTTTLSADGRRFAYTVSRVDGDVELRHGTVARGETSRVPHASAPVFSADGRWLAYSLGLSVAERNRRERAGEPIRSRVVLVDLASDTVTDVGEHATFAFSHDGSHLSLRGYEREDAGTDLIIRNLTRSRSIRFARVTAAAWRDRGSVIAFVVAHGDGRGSSVHIHDAVSGVVRALATDSATFSALTWREDHDDLAVLRRRSAPGFEEPTHDILLWRDAGTAAVRQHVLDPLANVSFPGAQRIVDTRPLRWSRDGTALFFGVRDWTLRSDTASPATVVADSAAVRHEPAEVEVWHSADVEIIPEQKVRALLEPALSSVAVWHVDRGRVIRLGTADLETVSLSDGAYALGLDARRYARERMFGPQLRDLHLIDIATGERKLVAEGVQYEYGISPTGRYVLYVRAGDYWTFDTRTRTHANITADVPAEFINLGHDYGLEDKPPFGTGGWTPGDRSVLLHDRYDVWEVRADGSRATRLTDGARERIRHRRIWLNPEDRTVDLSRPTYVGLHGETTRMTGYARLRPGGLAVRLLYVDAQVSRLSRASGAEVYMYRMERFDDSPDMFVGGPDLTAARQATRTNEFQDAYAWGRSELLEFVSQAGAELRAALFYPADYEPGRKYPLIVDIYENASSALHTYVVPSEHTMHNTTVFTHAGYFVLKPDIAYRLRDPGVSAVEALVPAVHRALATGAIDTARIGLVGHSWGAYQAAFAVTQTDLFAAAVAAAPLANMISMYLSIYWNTGGTDARMFEIDQGRMQVPFWEDVDAYIRNSPVFHIEAMTTPLLVAFGNRDGAVDWHQGIELYNAARRAGRDLVLLVYDGENHSLARRPNQVDYHRRANQWLAHYVKGEPPAAWITDGQTP